MKLNKKFPELENLVEKMGAKQSDSNSKVGESDGLRTAAIINHISIQWSIEDVQSVRPDLTNQQASAVLIHLEKNHDAEIGISWDTIEEASNFLFRFPAI